MRPSRKERQEERRTLKRYFTLECMLQLCPTLCNPMDCSISGFPVLHYLPEFAQIWSVMVSNPLLPSLLFAFSLSQHEGLFPSITIPISDNHKTHTHTHTSIHVCIHICVYLRIYMCKYNMHKNFRRIIRWSFISEGKLREFHYLLYATLYFKNCFTLNTVISVITKFDCSLLLTLPMHKSKSANGQS